MEDINSILGISEEPTAPNTTQTTQVSDRQTKTCPYCGEEILAVAKKCKHCGEWLEEKPAPAVKYITCPICGEDVEEHLDVCPHCNEPIDKKSVTSPSVQNSVQYDNSVSQQTADSTLFKNFLVDKSLSAGLFILLAARIVFDMLLFVESPVTEIITSITDLIFGSAMSLLIVQRFAQKRNMIDLTSFLALGSTILWPIAVYMGQSGISNIGLDILEYARWDDSNENVVKLRYFFNCGMVFFALSYILDIASKILLFTTAHPKYKTTIVVGIVSCVLGMIYTFAVKSMSEGLVLAGIFVVGLIQAIYYIMILVNGTGENN